MSGQTIVENNDWMMLGVDAGSILARTACWTGAGCRLHVYIIEKLSDNLDFR